jgi:hypothetical protein
MDAIASIVTTLAAGAAIGVQDTACAAGISSPGGRAESGIDDLFQREAERSYA